MEKSCDNYLHKKFKKQLSIDLRTSQQQNDKKDQDCTRVVEQSKEKINEFMQEEQPAKENIQIPQDNKEVVPSLSTNYVTNASILARSSISNDNFIGNLPTSTSCISSRDLNISNEDLYKSNSFDTEFSTNHLANPITSSTVDKSCSNEFGVSGEDISPTANDELVKEADLKDHKNEEVAPPPDRNPSGKYVCTYCNLVCSKPSVLQKHIRAHTNERPYPCLSCGFRFKTRSNLYKHCRSRTHANRVLGNKSQDGGFEDTTKFSADGSTAYADNLVDNNQNQELRNKPYKPRFHTENNLVYNNAKENVEENNKYAEYADSDILSRHISEIINKNKLVANANENNAYKMRNNEEIDSVNNNDYHRSGEMLNVHSDHRSSLDEPLNLTKSRKRSMSEVGEPIVQKSLIKEILLKNLYSDMQCPFCKMIFQTVTELELHKLKTCKEKPSSVKHTRSSSVNVASILTKNKNAFDSMPQFQNSVFPLNSPGPFLGKTRLVESDKSKSFSFDNGSIPLASSSQLSPSYIFSPILFNKEKKTPIRLFGGEVKVHSSGETKSYRIDSKDDRSENENFVEFGNKISENRVVKSSLQSGGTVLTNKTNDRKQDVRLSQDIIKVYENISVSTNTDTPYTNTSRLNFEMVNDKSPPNNLLLKPLPPINISSPSRASVSPHNTGEIMDFSCKSPKHSPINMKPLHYTTTTDSLLSPNSCMKTFAETPSSYSQSNEGRLSEEGPFLENKQLSLRVTGSVQTSLLPNAYNPVNLLVDGKIVRHVPGMPGPVVAEEDSDNMAYGRNSIANNVPTQNHVLSKEAILSTSKANTDYKFKQFLIPADRNDQPHKSPKKDPLEIKTDMLYIRTSDINSPTTSSEGKSASKEGSVLVSVEQKKFARPNTLALKPTSASLKQHHGLTPTIFNQILISPETPRVAKKYAQHFLHGNYFSYLGLKSSTKSVYCTLNKTQPFYVPHFKKLSMYSEWRQQDTKTDKLFVGSYDSRQRNQRYVVAGKTQANLTIHSSYKFVVSELPNKPTRDTIDPQKASLACTATSGSENNDEYTYIRGRGRGRYICEQCGIRCKKPSMLRKHIKTHSNDRPYKCSHCNFSFKTKGNLTKHMKSKAHTKNYTASSSSGSSAQLTPSSDSETEDSGMDSSDESSTRAQEHEAAYGLLSLSQKTTQEITCASHSEVVSSPSPFANDTSKKLCMSTEEIVYFSKTNYAKNKFLDDKNSDFSASKEIIGISEKVPDNLNSDDVGNAKVLSYLGKTSTIRPLTYPYQNEIKPLSPEITVNNTISNPIQVRPHNVDVSTEPKSIKEFHVIQKYANTQPESRPIVDAKKTLVTTDATLLRAVQDEFITNTNSNYVSDRVSSQIPTIKVNDVILQDSQQERKRKMRTENDYNNKLQKSEDVIDLSITANAEKTFRGNGTVIEDVNKKMQILQNKVIRQNVIAYPTRASSSPQNQTNMLGYDYNQYNLIEMKDVYNKNDCNDPSLPKNQTNLLECDFNKLSDCNEVFNQNNRTALQIQPTNNKEVQIPNYVQQHKNNGNNSHNTSYDNSAMETLADIATKQERLERNSLAKSLASEYLKLATKNENLSGQDQRIVTINKDVNELIVKPEGNKSCSICSKSFSKLSQLKLHMNIHYLERPFRCESCSVSFRTKGHLQKHERSAGHHNKLTTSPAQSSLEPRPFKCSDCNVAFRIHGHLAKHLRSKMHIMKLECLAKIPFGLYAELERSNSLLTEINTSDGDQCLESLKTLAQKVFSNDPSKLQSMTNQVDFRDITEDIDS